MVGSGSAISAGTRKFRTFNATGDMAGPGAEMLSDGETFFERDLEALILCLHD
jgi:hypothetical protein